MSKTVGTALFIYTIIDFSLQVSKFSKLKIITDEGIPKSYDLKFSTNFTSNVIYVYNTLIHKYY